MKSSALKKLGKYALITAGTLAAVCAGSTLAYSYLLVRPWRRHGKDPSPEIPDARVEPLELNTSDGIRLQAWAVYPRQASLRNWVVVLHGIRSNLHAAHRRAAFFAARGYNVLVLRFRAHGESDGELISYGFWERLDVLAAFNYILTTAGEHNPKIGLDGRSMGAAAAAYAVGNGEISPVWMILESCYDNIQNAFANRLALKVGHSFAPLVAWPVEQVLEQIARLRVQDLDPGKCLEKARCPVLMLAGDSEKVMKVAEIQYLYGCLREPKSLEIFRGAGHEDFLAYDPQRFAAAVDRFLRF